MTEREVLSLISNYGLRKIYLSSEYISIQNIIENNKDRYCLNVYYYRDRLSDFKNGGIFFDSHEADSVTENDIYLLHKRTKQSIILIGHNNEEYNRVLTNRIRDVFSIHHVG